MVGRWAGGDLSNIWKKNLWKLEFGHGKVAVQCLAGVVGFRCPLPYLIHGDQDFYISSCLNVKHVNKVSARGSHSQVLSFINLFSISTISPTQFVY